MKVDFQGAGLLKLAIHDLLNINGTDLFFFLEQFYIIKSFHLKIVNFYLYGIC